MISERLVILIARSGVLEHIIEKMVVLQLKEVAVIPENLGVHDLKDRLNELVAIRQVVKALEKCSCLVNEAGMIPFSLAISLATFGEQMEFLFPQFPQGVTKYYYI